MERNRKRDRMFVWFGGSRKVVPELLGSARGSGFLESDAFLDFVDRLFVGSAILRSFSKARLGHVLRPCRDDSSAS